MAKTIYVLNGPNLNLLGTREPEITARARSPTSRSCAATPRAARLDVEFRQSNHEGELVDWIQEAAPRRRPAIVINPAAYTHTSVAILDAIIGGRAAGDRGPHHQHPRARGFRHHSYISTVAKAVICGFGIDGYALAIDGLAALLGATKR